MPLDGLPVGEKLRRPGKVRVHERRRPATPHPTLCETHRGKPPECWRTARPAAGNTPVGHHAQMVSIQGRADRIHVDPGGIASRWFQRQVDKIESLGRRPAITVAWGTAPGSGRAPAVLAESHIDPRGTETLNMAFSQTTILRVGTWGVAPGYGDNCPLGKTTLLPPGALPQAFRPAVQAVQTAAPTRSPIPRMRFGVAR